MNKIVVSWCKVNFSYVTLNLTVKFSRTTFFLAFSPLRHLRLFGRRSSISHIFRWLHQNFLIIFTLFSHISRWLAKDSCKFWLTLRHVRLSRFSWKMSLWLFSRGNEWKMSLKKSNVFKTSTTKKKLFFLGKFPSTSKYHFIFFFFGQPQTRLISPTHF